jgi:hypothetical protein
VLYLLAFTTLRDQFQDRELRALADLMAERGVRLRIPTDAFWDDVDTEEEDSDEEGGDRGDYEYGHLRDREELKPY